MAQVVPTPLSSSLQLGVFALEASHKLPAISASKTFKSAWLSPAALQRYNRFIHRWRPLFGVSYLVSAGLTPVEVLAPAPITRLIAPLVTLLALPSTITTLLSLRYDMVVLLLGTFDFWYRAFALSVGVIAFVFHVCDARAIEVISIVGGNLLVLFMDANFHGMQSQVVLLAAAALVMLFDATAVAFSWIDDVHDSTVFIVDRNMITVRSIAANGFGLSSLLFLHNAYVRRSFAKTTTAQSLATTTQCVLYHCRLRWQPISSKSRLAIAKRHGKRLFQTETIQLRCGGLHQVFNARTTLLKASPESTLPPYHWSLRLAFTLSGIVGFAAMTATFATVARNAGAALSSQAVHTLSIVSFVTTVSVNAFFLVFVYQVEMLLLLYASFEFVFNFGQVFLVHVCVCSLSSWDTRVGAIVSSLLWMHWVCVIDAIPPTKRQQLGFSVRRIALVVHAVFLAALVLLSIDLLDWNSQRFVNRDVLHDVSWSKSLITPTANWSVGSFFLNRVAGLVLWSGRSLFRMATYDDDELLFLRGVVEFDDYEAAKRQQRTDDSKVKVDAIVQALSERSLRSVSEDAQVKVAS